MLRKLYGPTREERELFLRDKLKKTLPLLIIGVILYALGALILPALGGIGALLLVIALYMWGWQMVRGLFGVAAEGAFFTALGGGFVFSVIIIVLFVILGYVLGLINFLVGLIYYIYLKTAKRQSAR